MRDWIMLPTELWIIVVLAVMIIVGVQLGRKLRWPSLRQQRARRAWDNLYKTVGEGMIVFNKDIALEIVRAIDVDITTDYQRLPFVDKPLTWLDQAEVITMLRSKSVPERDKEWHTLGITFRALLKGSPMSKKLLNLDMKLFHYLASHEHYNQAVEVQLDKVNQNRNTTSPFLEDVGWTYQEFLQNSFSFLQAWLDQSGANVLRNNAETAHLIKQFHAYPSKTFSEASLDAFGQSMMTVYGLINDVHIPRASVRYDHLTFVLYCHFTDQMIEQPIKSDNVIPLRRKDK